MTDTKFTPGPWTPTATSDLQLLVCKGEKPEIIASVGTSNPKDAHLIAAAPDLYEALSDLVEACEHMGVSGGNIPNACAALAKARGEQ